VTRIVPAGDSAITLELDERIDASVNARAVATAQALKAARLPGVRDIVATYRSVTVYFDPIRANLVEIERALDAASVEPGTEDLPRQVQIPVCYGGDFGPDLGVVAAFAHVSEARVVELHAALAYRVFMLGFVPGFAYLGIVDERIAAPRRQTPRTRVAKGSVAIAGRQTGVYPCETPGGWQVIGRTPRELFNSDWNEPSLFAPGDEVRFEAIDRATFDRLSAVR
jgi:inhibitor of KinA